MIEGYIEKGVISSAQAFTFLQETRPPIFLDCSFVLPTSKEDVFVNFVHERIPGARFFDIKSTCDQDSDLPHMLPDDAAFADYMRSLGIMNDDFVILYGQSGMIMGPARVWWMMRGFGHRKVCVLNGGLPAWKAHGFPLQGGEPDGFNSSYYKAQPFMARSVVALEEMINISERALCPILDARPAERFNGTLPEPREGMRSGHIPNSLNLPCSALVDAQGLIKSEADLYDLFAEKGLKFDSPPERIVTTCGSGITACALALALYHIGFNNVGVYDGSWSEWGDVSSPTKIA